MADRIDQGYRTGRKITGKVKTFDHRTVLVFSNGPAVIPEDLFAKDFIDPGCVLGLPCGQQDGVGFHNKRCARHRLWTTAP